MVVRRLRIKGQFECLNGAGFCHYVAERFHITLEQADYLIPLSAAAQMPSRDLEAAKQAVTASSAEAIASTLITDEDYQHFLIIDYFDDISFEPIATEMEAMLAEAGKYMNLAFDTDMAENGLVHLGAFFQSYNRAMELLRAAAMQVGKADDRPDLHVFLSEITTNEMIAYVIENMQGFTNFHDSPMQPNMALRLPRETELQLRRTAIGDAILLASLHTVQHLEYHVFWRKLCEQILNFLHAPDFGVTIRSDNEDVRYRLTRNPRTLLKLIVDYCETYLGERGTWLSLFTSTGPLNNTGGTIRWTRRGVAYLEMFEDASEAHIYKCGVYILVNALNCFSDNMKRENGIPSFMAYMDDRGLSINNSRIVEWVSHANQTAQSNT